MDACLGRVDEDLRNLRTVRHMVGASRDDVAVSVGVSKALLSRFERGGGRLRRRHLDGYWKVLFPGLYKFGIVERKGKP